MVERAATYNVVLDGRQGTWGWYGRRGIVLVELHRGAPLWTTEQSIQYLALTILYHTYGYLLQPCLAGPALGFIAVSIYHR